MYCILLFSERKEITFNIRDFLIIGPMCSQEYLLILSYFIHFTYLFLFQVLNNLFLFSQNTMIKCFHIHYFWHTLWLGYLYAEKPICKSIAKLCWVKFKTVFLSLWVYLCTATFTVNHYCSFTRIKVAQYSDFNFSHTVVSWAWNFSRKKL